jgi:mRNA-degrading endonuclease RelE of RelBE toxin-antitoxin system
MTTGKLAAWGPTTRARQLEPRDTRAFGRPRQSLSKNLRLKIANFRLTIEIYNPNSEIYNLIDS